MTTYILHGGYTSMQNEFNRSFYQELTKDVPNGGRVLVVYFAIEEDEIADKFEQDKEKTISQSGGKTLSFEIASEDSFIEQIKRAHSIFIRGGHTPKLFAMLEKFSGFKDALKGKVVAGSSAGAYALSTYFFSNGKGEVFKGFGCLPIRLTCHYESERHRSIGNPLIELEKYPHNLELVALKDSEWRSFSV